MTQRADDEPKDEASGTSGDVGRLSARDRAVLAFERDWAAHVGGKQAAITATFGFSATRYYQLLARLVDLDEALRHDPLLIRRLRRRRRDREVASQAAAAIDRADGTIGRGPISE